MKTQTYEQFFRREFPAMVALAAAVSGSRIAAEDIAQEALHRAYSKWEEVSGFDKPGAWIRRVTINLAIGVATAEVECVAPFVVAFNASEAATDAWRIAP